MTPDPSPPPSTISSLGPDDLLDLLVHDMSPEQLTAYVERCHLLNVSAQTKRAAIHTEAEKLGVEREKRKAKTKSNVDEAMRLLKLHMGE